jgi:8-oxo-dGTP diphosphatase
MLDAPSTCLSFVIWNLLFGIWNFMPYTYDYPRPALTTDALIVARKEKQFFILLIERKFDPFKGLLALPGGFVNMNEELETACARELLEETGISVPNLKQFHTYGAVDRDPRGRTVSVVFWSILDELIEPVASDDAAKAEWIPINNLKTLAFDHQQIIEDFLNNLISH